MLIKDPQHLTSLLGFPQLHTPPPTTDLLPALRLSKGLCGGFSAHSPVCVCLCVWVCVCVRALIHLRPVDVLFVQKPLQGADSFRDHPSGNPPLEGASLTCSGARGQDRSQ